MGTTAQGLLRNRCGPTVSLSCSQASLYAPLQSCLPLPLPPLLQCPSWHQAQNSTVFKTCSFTRPVHPFAEAQSKQNNLSTRESRTGCSEEGGKLSMVPQHLLALALYHAAHLPSVVSTPGPALAELWAPAPPFVQSPPPPGPPQLPAPAQRGEARWMDGEVAVKPGTKAGTDTGVPFYYFFLINLRTALSSLLPPRTTKTN